MKTKMTTMTTMMMMTKINWIVVDFIGLFGSSFWTGNKLGLLEDDWRNIYFVSGEIG